MCTYIYIYICIYIYIYRERTNLIQLHTQTQAHTDIQAHTGRQADKQASRAEERKIVDKRRGGSG